MMYRVVNGIVALPKDQSLIEASHTIRFSNHLEFNPYNSKSDYFQLSFFAWTIPDWNQLNFSIAAAESLSQFKSWLAKTADLD